MILTLEISTAEKHDAHQITELVNSAYRGLSSKQGWTTEADLLLGCRTNIEEILQLISTEDSIFLLCKADTELVGSVHLQKQGASFTWHVGSKTLITRKRHRQTITVCR